MELNVGESFDFFGRVERCDESTYDSYPCVVKTEEGDEVIVRIPEGKNIIHGKIYLFRTKAIEFKEKIHLLASEFTMMGHLDLNEHRKEKLMRAFYHYAPIDLEKVSAFFDDTIDSLSNPVIKQMTETLYEEHKDDFLLYPAAKRFHHAYVSGLAYHTKTMLELSEGFLRVYPFLNKDLLRAGILLHDICKIREFDSYHGANYTVRGKLIGHITMGANLVHETAVRLGLEDTEEVMLLEHIMISHHYYGNYGSPKKPNIAEALIIHFIDNIDSKVCVLGEELDLVEKGDLTASIGVLERERYFKHHLTEDEDE